MPELTQYDQLGPGVGAMFAGQGLQSSQVGDQARSIEGLGQMLQQQQVQGREEQKLPGQLQQQLADIAVRQQEAQKQGLANQFTEATQPSGIQLAQGKNQQGWQHIPQENLDSFSKALTEGGYAAQIDSMQTPQQKIMAMAQLAAKNGVNYDDPMVHNFYQEIANGGSVSDVADKMFSQKGAYREGAQKGGFGVAEANVRGQAETQSAATRAEAEVQAAKVAAAGRVAVAQEKPLPATTGAESSRLRSLANDARTAGDNERAAQYEAQAKQADQVFGQSIAAKIVADVSRNQLNLPGMTGLQPNSPEMQKLQAQITKAVSDQISGASNQPQTPQGTAPYAQPNISEADYNKLQSGQTYFWNGKQLTKK